MATITQLILRFVFYGLAIIGVSEIIWLIKKKWKKMKKQGVNDCISYIIISIFLIITMGLIIIFNVDVYDSILGTLEIHTAIYIFLLIGGLSALFFLHRTIKEL